MNQGIIRRSGLAIVVIVAIAALAAGGATAFGDLLPDGRRWEMVSPADKHGGFIRPLIIEDAIQASSVGSAFTFLSEQSLFPEAHGSAVFDQVIARRTSSGWQAEDIAVPHDLPPGQGVGQGQEYRLFSPDLSAALVQPFGAFTPLSPEATERTPYLRNNGLGSYEPLLTPADVPAGTKFGGDPTSSVGPVDIVGATPDLAHVLLHTTGLALSTTPVTDGLYEWSAGGLRLVNLLPQAAGGTPVEALLGAQGEEAQHAISNDGSRVFWQGESEGEPHLYLRDTLSERTLQLDTVQAGAPGGSSAPRFQIASADGTKVFFSDEQRLTSNSGTEGRDLYECELPKEPPGSVACALEDLTPAQLGHNAELPRVAVLGASEDGSYLYLRAHGVLATNENPATGETAAPEANNLYLLHNNGTEWTTSFIATLASEDTQNAARALTARVSPDGQYFAFMSNRSLTGYNNNDAVSGQPDEEVYLYRAATVPHLICASCNPSGARPRGVFESGELRLPVFNLIDEPGTWEGSAIAANVPTQQDFSLGEARYQPRFLSNDGRLFFNSADALVPQDVNGQWDVYEYEPAGAGSCTTEAETFNSKTGGCVSLISSGRASQESAFLGASETGGDVFFVTYARLSPQDLDEQLDVYDAHECSLSPCIAPPSESTASTCATGEACRPSASTEPPPFGAPASAALSGEGNLRGGQVLSAAKRKPTRAQLLAHALRACRARPRRQRAKCRAAASRRYGGAAHAGKTSQPKRTAR